MREILFRGKRQIIGDWVEGYFVPDPAEMQGRNALFAAIVSFDKEQQTRVTATVKRETVGQFTGLTDKNGKKIFEGDIIRYADIYDYNCYLESLENPEAYEGTEYSDIWTIDEVVYGIAINYPAFDLNRHSFEANGLSELSESSGYFYEVIGNIHDNPELLGAQS